MKKFSILLVLILAGINLSSQNRSASQKNSLKDVVAGVEVLEVKEGESSKGLELSAKDMQW